MSFLDITIKLLNGFGVSLALFALTLVISLPLGLVFCAGSRCRIRIVRYIIRAFIYIIRGTPLLLQLMIIVYIPGIVFDSPLTKWAVFGGSVSAAYFFGALLAFVINYSCYFSEIYRGGIENMPKGQYEAGQVLGMTKSQIFFKVILLQVFKRVLTPIANETITLVKDTALARTVSVMEIFFCAGEILRTNYIIWPLFYAGAFYLIFNAVVTAIFNHIEKKLNYFKA